MSLRPNSTSKAGSINSGPPTSRTRLLADTGGSGSDREFDKYGSYNAFSDSEAYSYGGGNTNRAPKDASSPPYARAYSDFEATDDEDARGRPPSNPSLPDEFLQFGGTNREKSLRTGRQRKKLAARTKGGEFQARRRKRRVYFCCVSSDIDVQRMFDYLTFGAPVGPAEGASPRDSLGGSSKAQYGATSSSSGGGGSGVGSGGLPPGWHCQLYPGGDVLHLYKPGVEAYMDAQTEPHAASLALSPELDSQVRGVGSSSSAAHSSAGFDYDKRHSEGSRLDRHNSMGSQDGTYAYAYDDDGERGAARCEGSGAMWPEQREQQQEQRREQEREHEREKFDNRFRIAAAGAQEVFVFDFGAVVFWGFSRGEESALLKTTRLFAKGLVGREEFEPGEDDMAFATSPDLDGREKFTLANDFITLPDQSSVKDRLSISFAIGQSSVLAIFEDRIERKVEEYKYIPEALAALGKVHLTEQQLGIMIGEVFVIRHDVNLHTEILDTPSFFWKEEAMEQDYKMVMDYLEMTGRTEILNKRLDMLRELLDVLQQQMESNHAMNLEWIVIWLIVVEVVLQLVAIGTDSIGTYLQQRSYAHK